jgi:23S rRNA (uracil1939-C5)-methyltransferase
VWEIQDVRTNNANTSESIPLYLEKMGRRGDTISHLDGDVVNVFGGIVGEKVQARVFRYRRRKKKYVSALVMNVLKSSPHRISAPCPYFGPCSGCQWQHIEYGHQLKLKRNAVVREMQKYPELIGVPVRRTEPGPEQFSYRNHARFTVRQQGSLGFNNRITRRFVKLGKCLLMDPQINEIMADLQDKCDETTNLSVRVGINTAEYLIQPTLQLAETTLMSGQAYYEERLLDRAFRVSSPSFFQVNTAQTEIMARRVLKALKLCRNQTVVDAYAGVGTFTVLMAESAGKVVAIEESEAAVKDAAINTLGIENIEFRLGKTEEVIYSLDAAPDAVVLDPSRTGCHTAVLEALIRLTPSRIVYVSCDPESLARDLAVLVKGAYRVNNVEPIDMFPQTHHVECIATLSSTKRNLGNRAF